MTTPLVLPSAERVVVRYLLTQPVLTDKVGTRIGTTVPASPTYPLVALRRYAGAQRVAGWLDSALLQFDCYGTTKAEAEDVAHRARAAVYAIPADPMNGAVVTGVTETIGLGWLPPDESNPAPHYTFGVAVTLHPA